MSTHAKLRSLSTQGLTGLSTQGLTRLHWDNILLKRLLGVQIQKVVCLSCGGVTNGASEAAENDVKHVLLFSSVLLCFIKVINIIYNFSHSIWVSILESCTSCYTFFLLLLFQSGFPPGCTITSMSRCTSACGPLETSLHPDVIADLLKDSSIKSHRSIVVECLTCLSKRNSLRLSMNCTQEPQIHNKFWLLLIQYNTNECVNSAVVV